MTVCTIKFPIRTLVTPKYLSCPALLCPVLTATRRIYKIPTRATCPLNPTKMANTPSTSGSTTLIWGATLSAAIESRLPAVAYAAVNIGLEHDPSALIHQLNTSPDDPTTQAFLLLLQATNTALDQVVYKRNNL